jgi:hypothetical protein
MTGEIKYINTLTIIMAKVSKNDVIIVFLTFKSDL